METQLHDLILAWEDCFRELQKMPPMARVVKPAISSTSSESILVICRQPAAEFRQRVVDQVAVTTQQLVLGIRQIVPALARDDARVLVEFSELVVRGDARAIGGIHKALAIVATASDKNVGRGTRAVDRTARRSTKRCTLTPLNRKLLTKFEELLREHHQAKDAYRELANKYKDEQGKRLSWEAVRQRVKRTRQAIAKP